MAGPLPPGLYSKKLLGFLIEAFLYNFSKNIFFVSTVRRHLHKSTLVSSVPEMPEVTIMNKELPYHIILFLHFAVYVSFLEVKLIIFNRPGVAGAVLQTAWSLTD